MFEEFEEHNFLSSPIGGQGVSNLIPHIEALIFASDKPLTPVEITDWSIMLLVLWKIR